MNWDMVNALAATAGAIGVIISLAFLVYEVRRNTRAVQASSYQASLNTAIDLNSQIATDESLANSLFPEEGIETVRMRIHVLNGFRHLQQLYMQWRAGLITKVQWNTHFRGSTLILASPSVQRCWSNVRDHFHPGFVVEVDSHVASLNLKTKDTQPPVIRTLSSVST